MRLSNQKAKATTAATTGSLKLYYAALLLAALGAQSIYVSKATLQYLSDAAQPLSDAPQPLYEAVHEKGKTIVNVTERPPTLFVFEGNGVRDAIEIITSALPEYDVVRPSYKRMYEYLRFERELKAQGRNNPYDFVVRPLRYFHALSNQRSWIHDEFRGIEILVTGENWGDYMPERMEHKFALASLPEINPKTSKTNDRVLTLTYMQMVWYTRFRPQLDTGGKPPEALLIDASLRPRGNATKDSLIYAHGNCVDFREEAFAEISKLFPVFYGGKCKGSDSNNLQNRTKVENKIGISNWDGNIKFYSNYRFCLVMEHAKEQPYLTEKILMAFLAGCIPIYYGSDMALDIFHQDAFIYYDIENPKPALEKIARLEQDPNLYRQILEKPILRDGENTIAKYFSFRDDIGGGQFKKRIREAIGVSNYEFVK